MQKKSNGNGFISRLIHGRRSIGERAADGLAKWAGSWTFILSFMVFLAIWISVNIYAWINVWDPYPFILLNLVLSCIAAMQAPIILMSQNRQAKKDRAKMKYDYDIDRKSEKMIEEILGILKKRK